MLLNVVLYRRKFSSHKYLVVALVTTGISMFMLLGPGGKKGGSDSAWGLTLLGIKWVIEFPIGGHAIPQSTLER
jgi:UDP-galactose transporter B1